jgi:hypothetical protein
LSDLPGSTSVDVWDGGAVSPIWEVALAILTVFGGMVLIVGLVFALAVWLMTRD